MAVVEVCAFTVVADENAVRAADARLQTEFAYQQPGLLRRTTARGEEGQWCVITLWQTVDDAVKGSAAAATDEVAVEFWSLVDTDSVRMQRFTLL
jgi:hypothetical protein